MVVPSFIRKYFKSPSVNLTQPPVSNNCLCTLISPILWISLILGQNVSCKSHIEFLEVSSCPKDKNIRQSCIFQYNVRSLGSIINWVFLLFYIYITFWIYMNLGDHLGVFFHGTDLYTFGFEIISIYVQTTLLLLFARIRAPYLSKCLNHIQKFYVVLSSRDKRCTKVVGGDLKQHQSSAKLQKIRVVSYILVIFVSISSAIYAFIFLYTIFGLTIPYADEVQNSDPQFANKKKTWREVIFILEKFAHIILPLQSQVFTILFAVTAFTIRYFYLRLGDCLASLLSPFSSKELFEPSAAAVLKTCEQTLSDKRPQLFYGSPARLASELERLRLVYEELGKGVKYLSKYFGPGLITSCSINVLAITSGVYTIILEQTNLSTPIDDTNQAKRSIRKYFFANWSFHIYFALFSLLVSLISGQNITNAASVPGKILKSATQEGFDDDAKHQVNLFLKSSEVPTHVTACSIININLSFVGSAATQLVTYVLVLLQFRLGFANAHKDHD